MLGADEKRLHLFHTMTHGASGEGLATGEHMLLHVDTRQAAPARGSSPVASRSPPPRRRMRTLPSRGRGKRDRDAGAARCASRHDAADDEYSACDPSRPDALVK